MLVVETIAKIRGSAPRCGVGASAFDEARGWSGGHGGQPDVVGIVDVGEGLQTNVAPRHRPLVVGLDHEHADEADPNASSSARCGPRRRRPGGWSRSSSCERRSTASAIAVSAGIGRRRVKASPPGRRIRISAVRAGRRDRRGGRGGSTVARARRRRSPASRAGRPERRSPAPGVSGARGRASGPGRVIGGLRRRPRRRRARWRGVRGAGRRRESGSRRRRRRVGRDCRAAWPDRRASG